MDNSLIENFVWAEKYRPHKISECVLSDSIKVAFEGFVHSKSFPNLLLSGGAGVGKTTLARALCEELDYECIVINGSDQRNIDTVRVTIREFASTRSMFGKNKCIIIDEADGFNPMAQAALRATMEEFHFVKFILTCNYKNKLIEPIHSRTTGIDFVIPKSEKSRMTLEFVKRVFEILKQESIEFDKNAVVEVVKKFFPDNRRTLNELQRLSSIGNISQENVKLALNDSDVDSIINSLKSRDLTQVRQWIVNNISMDTESFYRTLYEGLYKVVKEEDIPQVILVISKYMYQGAFVADPEINLMAMMVEIMQSVDFK